MTEHTILLLQHNSNVQYPIPEKYLGPISK